MRICLILSCLFFDLASTGQNISIIQKCLFQDSSYYDICAVSDSEYWVGGENGVLKSIDDKGNIRNIQYPGKEETILAIKKSGNYIYLSGDRGVIYIYDTQSKEFTKKKFAGKLSGSCFYGLLVLKDSSILVCGGNRKLLKKKTSMPGGFIFHLDAKCNNTPEYLWKSNKGFVTSMIDNIDNNKIYAVVLNFFNSKIITSDNPRKKWKKYRKYHFFIYAISFINSELWYCGSSDRHLVKNAVVGNDHQNIVLKDKLCIWNILDLGERILCFARNGEIISLDKYTFKTSVIKNLSHSMYKSINAGKDKAFVVGNGGEVIRIGNDHQ